MNTEQNLRIDKWLWAARFFKTRNSAADAVNGGKVHVNGHRVKPSRPIQFGDRLEITRGQFRTVIEIKGLSDKRGPAKDAQKLYEESKESIQERELKSQQRKLLSASMPQSHRKPDKRQRRQIRKVREKL